MLLSKRCPHTNVLNFFDEAEPHLAIGSITKCGTSAAPDGYTWRFYVSEVALSGHTADAPSAERHLRASQLSARNTCIAAQH
jgi:hypothetical protein